MKKAPKIINLTLLLVICLISNVISAADPNPPAPLAPSVPPGLPIDGGILILGIAALLYSFYFFRKRFNYSK